MKRAFLNVFLFLFAPVTRQSIEMLLCREPCDDDEDTGNHDLGYGVDQSSDCGPPVLVFDAAVTCYEGEHLLLMIMSITVLVVMVLALPAILLFVVRRTRVMRAASLGLRGSAVDRWWTAGDKDNSGVAARGHAPLLPIIDACRAQPFYASLSAFADARPPTNRQGRWTPPRSRSS